MANGYEKDGFRFYGMDAYPEASLNDISQTRYDIRLTPNDILTA